ncbi:MAG: ATP-binding protein [Methylococcales bacterium]
MKQFSLSFKIKLRIVILSVSIVGLTVALLGVGIFNIKKHRQLLIDNVEILAKSTAYNLTPTLTFNDSISAKEILHSLNASPDILAATLFDTEGHVFAQYHVSSLAKGLPAVNYKNTRTRISQYSDFEYLEYNQPVIANKKQIGTLLIQSSLDKVSVLLKEYFFISLVVIIAALPVILILSEFLQRIITKPIISLSQAIHDIQRQANYSARVEVTSHDEIGALIIDFNKMLSILESRDQELLEYQSTLEQKIEKRTKDLLLAKDLAESANKAKSEFLSSMSHELRTPMNSILGFAQLVEMDELTAEHKEANDAILKAGYHLLDLIDKILDLSKIESGHLSLNKEHCSLNMILNDCINLIRPLADKMQVKINCFIDENNDYDLEVDLTRLNQVIINILSNAVKYNRFAGIIIIKHERIDNDIRISIMDSGNGLSEEQMAKVFLPFERLNAANSAIEGTGVGLTICKKIITAMKGDIGVFSKIGEGTTFWVRFPVK